MARARKHRLFPVALSLQSAAEAMQIPVRIVREAAYSGALEARLLPGKRIRCTVASLVSWWATFPRATKRRTPK